MRESFFLKPAKPWFKIRWRSPLILWAFRKIWRKRFEEGSKLIEVRGWRTCLMDERAGQRKVSEFLFKVPFTKGRWVW